MIHRASNILARMSLRAYPLVLGVYPRGFRREFGESMTQVFRDLVHDACRTSGVAGLLRLWLRTVMDVVVSLVGAYTSERREAMFRTVVAVGVLYLGVLGLASGYGAIRFGEFYDPPAFTMFNAAGPVDENKLEAAYGEALRGEFGRYKAFAAGTGILLAVLLGLASALFGLWQRSIPHGAGAFLAGAALTVLVFQLLPTIWFPFDRYPVGALWVMGAGLPLAALVWLVVTAIGRYWPASGRLRPA